MVATAPGTVRYTKCLSGHNLTLKGRESVQVRLVLEATAGRGGGRGPRVLASGAWVWAVEQDMC